MDYKLSFLLRLKKIFEVRKEKTNIILIKNLIKLHKK